MLVFARCSGLQARWEAFSAAVMWHVAGEVEICPARLILICSDLIWSQTFYRSNMVLLIFLKTACICTWSCVGQHNSSDCDLHFRLKHFLIRSVFCGVQLTVNCDFMQQYFTINNCIALRVLYHLTVQSPSGIPRNFVWGGVQQIQLRTEDRENGDPGAVAP